MIFKKIPLKTEFLTAPIILSIAFGMLFYFFIENSNKNIEELEKSVDSNMHISEEINNLHKRISLNHNNLFRIIANKKSNYEKSKTEIVKILENMERLSQDFSDKNYFKSLKISKEEYKNIKYYFTLYSDALKESIIANETKNFFDTFDSIYNLNRKYNKLNIEFFKLYKHIKVNIRENFLAKKRELERKNDRYKLYLLSIIILATILSFYLATIFSKNITSMISYMQNIIDGVGNREAIPNLDRDDELGKMAKAITDFEKVFENLQKEILKREKVEKDLKLTSAIFENSNEGFIITDVDLKILKVNRAFEEISGYKSEYILGKTPSILKSNLYDKKFYYKMWHNLLNKNIGYWMGEVYNKKPDGSLYPVLLKIYAIKNHNNRILNYIGIFTDLSKLKKSQENINYLANYDFLTALPNRNYFKKEISDKILTRKKFALVFIGLDRFKYINNSLGYSIGDSVLKHVAKRVRSKINNNIFLARIRGDEFALLFDCSKTEENCRRYISYLIDDILKELIEPMKIGNYELIINASAGMSIFPIDAQNEEDILKATNTALEKAKEKNKGSLTIFTKEMAKDTKRKYLIDKSLQENIELSNIECHYQPIVDAKTREIRGFEALARWNHKKLGYISPELFIPIAEENGVIIQLTRKILFTACKRVNYWNRTLNRSYFISVNFSPANLLQNDIVDMIEEILYLTKLPANLLKIEITENLFLEHNEELLNKFKQLKKMKVNLSIDDFGTGYSSMQYLKAYPINNLKIDRSFIVNVPTDKYNSGICSAILNLAKGINIDVIAEGVEDEESAKFLQENGCTYLQGFYFSKALDYKRCEELLQLEKL